MGTASPQGRRAQLGYVAGLDGVRGLAVVAVLLYHGGVPWAGGGFLGVEAFFVLSGFLITSLLVSEWRESSTIKLKAFWARRARRLLPALFCLVAVIGVYYAVIGPNQIVPGLESDGISTLLYVGNWHQIASGASYFAAAGPVSPLQHTWSLAIEEQFYVCWPLLVLGILWLSLRRTGGSAATSRGSLRLLLAVSLAGTVASAIDMGLLFHGGAGINRVYYGTDTRAGGLLAGASLAIAMTIAHRRGETAGAPDRARERRRVLPAAALVALAGVLAAIYLADSNAMWLYPFGLVGVDLAVVLVIAAVVTAPGSLVGRLLSLRPIRLIGAISYGLYLWHFPLYLWIDADATGLGGTALLVLRLAVTLAVSIVSFVVVEQPIRRGRMPGWLLRPLTPVAAGGAVATLIAASAVASPWLSSAAAPPPERTAYLMGSDPGCTMSLQDSSQYGLAPPATSQATRFEYGSLNAHRMVWKGSSRLTFHTCPPKKVLLIGDSLAFTLGVGMMHDEQHYGVELANAAILGCAFTPVGELNVSGTWESQSAGCPNALSQWARIERNLYAQAVIVELGYRDQFDWRIAGRVTHLGQAAFDAQLKRRIDRYAQVLSRGGTQVLFLSVPWARPPALPDGSPGPAASPARHSLINSMLLSAARRDPAHVRVLDIDKVVSPGNRYQAEVNSRLCRFDGIHFTVYCSTVLQPDVLGTVRTMIDH